MLALIALVVSVGVVDSLNPSTIGPALYLVTLPDGARQLAGFTGGVLAVALAGGLVLTLGPGQAILAAVPHPGPDETHEIEMALGALALAVALVLWIRRRAVERRFSGGGPRTPSTRSAFFAGAAIMAIELPTALPYFAVITAIVSSGRRVSAQISLLVLFNLAFVAPLLLVLAFRLLARERGARLLDVLHARIDRWVAVAVPAAIAIVGAVLVTIGAIGAT
ncbi:MAG TPA: GAP family protein [Gaiellaceae bacterium]|nr:GAP family protein [Gaiellaceae bacterium]